MDWNTISIILWGILVGAGAGAGASFIGYMKGKTLEQIEWDKAFATIVLGLIIGGLAAYMGVPFDEAYQIVLALGLVTLINQVAIALYRRIMDWWAKSHPPTPTPAEPDPDIEAAIDASEPKPKPVPS
jgi:hypothetical protein